MKTFTLFLILANLSICGYSQRFLQHPSYEFRNTGIYKINRIELSDQSTRIQLLSEFIPGWWVAFSKDKLYLEAPETGEKFPVQAVEGIQWGQKKPTPKTGVDTFLFTFPPLPKQLKTINWIDDGPCILGISLEQSPQPTTTLPAEFNGNWISTDGNNRWTFGFYKDFVIAENRFWDYESVQKKGKSLVVNLKSDQKRHQLLLTLQKDGNCKIGPDKRRQFLYQPENNIPESTRSTDTLPQQSFFQPGSKAHLQGYIRGYHPRAGFKSGLIYCNDITTGEDFPIVVELLPDGRFSADIPLDFPVLNSIILDRNHLQFYAVPGDTLTVFIDWEDWLLADRYRNRQFSDFRSLRFMGPSSKINADQTIAQAHIKTEGNIEFEKLAHKLTPLAFKAQALQKLHQKLHTLDTLSLKYHFAPGSRQFLETKIKIDIAEYILDFAMTRKYFQKETTNPILNTPVTPEYYDFLQQMPLDDPNTISPYGNWAFFNRFEYAAPFDTIYRNPDLQVPDPVKRTANFWHLKDSIYTHYFKLPSTFSYEVIKLRELANGIEYEREQIDSILSITLQGISHPYLRFKAKQIIQKHAPDKVATATPLPNTKSAAIFRKLIAPYQGKVIFVDFWSTGCGPCRSGIKNMAPLREKYEGKDIVFLFITDEKSSPLKPYNDFMSDVKGEKLRISEDDHNYLRELFQFNGIPHYETINKKGEVVNLNAYSNLSQEAIFDKLLEE